MRQSIQGGCTQQPATKNKILGCAEKDAVGLGNDKNKDGEKKTYINNNLPCQ
jgi:hypothetical protein